MPGMSHGMGKRNGAGANKAALFPGGYGISGCVRLETVFPAVLQGSYILYYNIFQARPGRFRIAHRNLQ